VVLSYIRPTLPRPASVTDLSFSLSAVLGTAYRLERELGGGGMSRVFLAEETALGRRVVIKVLPPDTVAGVNADRFRREIQLAAQLQHPAIVPLLTAGASDGLLWYAMPFVEGASLRAKLARSGQLPLDEAVRAWRDLLEALEYAHAHGVVHRDIKPENIMLSGRHAVVLDFGVAKAVSASTGVTAMGMTGLGMAIGTPAYMAPEQIAGESNTDGRLDLYAAGLVMYEMLSGRGPFEATTASEIMAAHIAKAPSPLGALRGGLPAALEQLVMQCLEKSPAARPRSATDVLQALDTMSSDISGARTPSGTPRPRVRNGCDAC
jgi:serine/threonine protein kinase